jgi:hypothetical protein
MARARKPTGEDKKLSVSTSGFGFEYDEDDDSDEKAKWKVGWYQGNNSYRQLAHLPGELEAICLPSLFTPGVCAQLATDFNFTDAQVEDLARRVEAALDPDLNQLTLTVAQSDGERRGTAAAERGFAALTDAQERTSDALSVLAPLRAIAEDGDARRTLKSVIKAVDQCQASALEAMTILDSKLRQKGLLYLPVVADKRQVDAARRTVILTAIFAFWEGIGRNVTCTSNSDERLARRSGPLVELCHAVFRLARTDGSSVSGDTITDAIEAWRNR